MNRAVGPDGPPVLLRTPERVDIPAVREPQRRVLGTGGFGMLPALAAQARVHLRRLAPRSRLLVSLLVEGDGQREDRVHP